MLNGDVRGELESERPVVELAESAVGKVGHEHQRESRCKGRSRTRASVGRPRSGATRSHSPASASWREFRRDASPRAIPRPHCEPATTSVQARARRGGGHTRPVRGRCWACVRQRTTGWWRCSLAWTLVVPARNGGRGIALGLASAKKFAPLALARAVAAGRPRARPTTMLVYASAFAATLALVFVAYLPDGGFREPTTGRSDSSSPGRRRSASGGATPDWAPVRTVVDGASRRRSRWSPSSCRRDRDLIRLAASVRRC